MALAAQFLGQAFATAYAFVQHNKAKVAQIASEVENRKEIFGDDLNRLLDSAQLEKPEIDWTKEETWPQMTSTDAPRDAAPTSERAPRPHQLRLTLIYGGLAVIFACAIAGVVVFAGRTIHPGPAWSSWKPKGGGQGAAQEIAAHVGRLYRLPNGDQLVDVISKAPLHPVGQRPGPDPLHRRARDERYAGSVFSHRALTNSVMYSLCGLGASCAIASGTPTLERGRHPCAGEILELALYTFKYVGGIQNDRVHSAEAAGGRPAGNAVRRLPGPATSRGI